MRLRAPLLILCVLPLCACTYDFDGAFAGKAEGGQASSMGGSGGNGGGGGSGGSATGGGAPSGELCFNGTDDDGDDLADCADPDCSTATCAPAAPDGWSGPAALALGGADRKPSCPDGLTAVTGGTGAIDAPPATCEACDCAPPSGGSCEIGTTTVYDDNNVCAGDVDTMVTPSSANDCFPFSVGQPSSQAVAEPIPVDAPGSCQPSGGAATASAASFVESMLLCSDSAGAGCTEGVCLPAEMPFAQICVYTDGDVICPSDGPYTDKRILYTGITDDRGCTDCSCEPATGQSCAGTTELYSGSNCGNLQATLPHDGMTCESFNVFFATASAMFIPGAGPSGGSCLTSGGLPKGSASPAAPITVCCLPEPPTG